MTTEAPGTSVSGENCAKRGMAGTLFVPEIGASITGFA
jgi:hypothetical protein